MQCVCGPSLAVSTRAVAPRVSARVSSSPASAFGARKLHASTLTGRSALGGVSLERSTERTSASPTALSAYRTTVPERIIGSLPYLLPLFDGLRYGRFFFMQFPGFSKVLEPLLPLVELYFSVPFAPILVFFAVYLGIVNNMEMSRFVRFNAMQAVLLDIILIVPSLIENIFRPGVGGGGFALQLYITCYNTIWLFVFASFAYGVGSCMVGQTARIPLVADAADAQVR